MELSRIFQKFNESSAGFRKIAKFNEDLPLLLKTFFRLFRFLEIFLIFQKTFVDFNIFLRFVSFEI